MWKPLQKWKLGKVKQPYHNIVGQTAIVAANGLSKESGGEVTWSGAIMKAKLAENEHSRHVEAGAQVVIQDIIGNTLIVTTKHKE